VFTNSPTERVFVRGELPSEAIEQVLDVIEPALSAEECHRLGDAASDHDVAFRR
jgi:hypothetical protein